MSYINIPSDFALNKSEAIESFYQRHSNLLDRHGCLDFDKIEARGIEGISYQGDCGEQVYLDFEDFFSEINKEHYTMKKFLIKYLNRKGKFVSVTISANDCREALDKYCQRKVFGTLMFNGWGYREVLLDEKTRGKRYMRAVVRDRSGQKFYIDVLLKEDT